MSNQSAINRAKDAQDKAKRALAQSLESKQQFNAEIRSIIKGVSNVRNQNN